MDITLKANQAMDLTVSGALDDNTPAPLQGSPSWENLSPSVVRLDVDPSDPKKVTISGLGIVGPAVVRVTVTGLDPLLININFTSFYATKIVVTPGTPRAA